MHHGGLGLRSGFEPSGLDRTGRLGGMPDSLASSWVRSAGTYSKVVNGLAQNTPDYQPVKGDMVQVDLQQRPLV